MKGIDYSFGRPDLDAVKANGIEFVLRYCPYPGDGGKGLTVDEIAAIHAHGMGVGLVFESVGERHLGGYTAGVADGHTVLASLAGLAYPKDAAVYFAVDFDAGPNDMHLIDEYQRGVASVIGLTRTGVYGSYEVVKHCAEAGTATYFWQTYAWSGGMRLTAAQLYQYRNGVEMGGAEVDLNASYGDAGLWMPREDVLTKDDIDAAVQKALEPLAKRIYQLEAQVWGENPVTPRGTADAPYADATMFTVDTLVKQRGASAAAAVDGTFQITGQVTLK